MARTPLNQLLLLDFLESYRDSKEELSKWELVKRHRSHPAIVKMDGHHAERSIQGRIPAIKKLLAAEKIYLNTIKRDGRTVDGWKVGDSQSPVDVALTEEAKTARIVRLAGAIQRENQDTILAQEVGLLSGDVANRLTVKIKSRLALEDQSDSQTEKRDWPQELKEWHAAHKK